MRRDRTWISLALAVLVICMSGCDRGGPPAVVPAAPREPNAVRVEPLAPLEPGRPTHVTVDDRGAIAWAQESDEGEDTVYALADDGVPTRTRLTSDAVGGAAGAAGATGNIQSLAALGGDLLFYFTGQTDDHRFVAVVGRYFPATDRVQILADAKSLMAATGAGNALAVARGQVVVAGPVVWVWLYTVDRMWLLQIDRPTLPGEGMAKLLRPFNAPEIDVAADLPMRSDAYRVGGSPAGDLLVTDLRRGALWRISPTGVARVVRWWMGLPQYMSGPGADDAGRAVLFVGEGEPLRTIGTDHPEDPGPGVTVDFPALLRVDAEGKVAALGQERFVSPADAGLPFRLRPEALANEPGGKSWVAYDPTTGQLVRLRLIDKP